MCQSLRSHSGTTSKPILALLSSLTWLLDPKNAQTEKCDVGQITAVVLLKKKSGIPLLQTHNPWIQTNLHFCASFPLQASREGWKSGGKKGPQL